MTPLWHRETCLPVRPQTNQGHHELYQRRGRARHSVRAAMANQDATIGRHHHESSKNFRWPAAAGRGLPALPRPPNQGKNPCNRA